jgi:hypothetical protein
MQEDERAARPNGNTFKRDAATVAAVVSAGASLVSAGAAVWSATQQSKPQDDPPSPPPSVELPPGIDSE